MSRKLTWVAATSSAARRKRRGCISSSSETSHRRRAYKRAGLHLTGQHAFALGHRNRWPTQRAWSVMTKTNPTKKAGTEKRVMRDRRALPSRQRAYTRLYARVDRIEDAISHFYNVINELRRRVSTLEKKLKPLAIDD